MSNCLLKNDRHFQGHVPRFSIHRESEPLQVLVTVASTNSGLVLTRVLPYLDPKEDAEWWKNEQSVIDRQEHVAWADVTRIRCV